MTINQVNTKGRLSYLDALRGFTMLLVVWHHVANYSFGLKIEDSFLMELFISFRMPMFFFISGYIAYKDLAYWSLSNTYNRILIKAQVQIIPTIIFWSCGMLFLTGVSPSNLISQFQASFPGFWWFTIGLFIMFMVYYFASVISKYTKSWLLFPIMIIIACILFVFKDSLQASKLANNITLPYVARFIIFFIFGLFIRKHQQQFFKELNKTWLILLSLICVCLFTYLSYGSGLELSHNLKALIRTIIGFPFIIIVFNIFYRLSEFWEKHNCVSNSLKFIGRSTLDLYVLHFFFIPDLKWMTPYIIGVNQTIPQFFTISTVSIGITIISLAISRTLRTSPFLAKYLFGVRPKKS